METLVRHSTLDAQDDLVRRYCAEAEAHIRRAGDAAQAHRWGEEICARLEKECSSKLILDATRSYIEQVIRGMFGDRR